MPAFIDRTVTNAVLSTSAALCLALICYVGHALLLHPLSRFPGPKLWALSGIPFFYRHIRGTLPFDIKELHEKYGDIVRVAPGQLALSHPDAWKDAMGHGKASGELTKPDWFYKVGNQPSNITNETTKQHSLLRRRLAHGFSERSIREQESLIQRYVDSLIGKLNSQADSPVDIVKWYNFTTFDIIGDLVFGESFHCLESEQYHEWIANIFLSGRLGTILQALSFMPLLKDLLFKLITSREARQRHEDHLSHTKAKMTRRIQNGRGRCDLIEGLISRQEELGLSLDELISNAEILIIGGSETTATLLSGVTFLLLTHPESLRLATQEVRSAFRNEGEISLLSGGQLVYMSACLNEAMRLYPPIANGLPRTVPLGGADIMGEAIPPGTDVAIHHWSIYHREKYFKDAMEFHPERFLDDPKYINDCRDVLQPFHVGPRSCLGRNLAYAEMRLILAKVLYTFDLSLEPSSRDWMNQKNYLMWKKEPLLVRCSPASYHSKNPAANEDGDIDSSSY